MNIKASDVFKDIEEQDLITLAQLYPQQLLDMCILLSLDYQLQEENKPNYIN